MRVNTKCSIALHCLLFIAEYGDSMKVTGDLLAKSTGCHAAAIRSILGALRKNNVITIHRGVGGAKLAHSCESITIWEVYHALEPQGSEHIMALHPHPNPQCPIGKQVDRVLKTTYQPIVKAIEETMKTMTLQDLMNCYHEEKDS